MNIYLSELHKLLSFRTLISAFLFVLLQALLTLFYINSYLPIESLEGELAYIEYHILLSGPLTQEKAEYIQAEYIEITETITQRNDVISAYEQGLLDKDTFQVYTERYHYAITRESAITRIYTLYEYINQTDYPFVYDTGWLLFLRDYSFNWLVPAMLCLFLIPFYSMEWTGYMLISLKASRYGLFKITGIKVIVGTVFTVIIAICMLFTDFIIMQSFLPLTDGSAVIRCFPAYADAPDNWSIMFYAFMQYTGIIAGIIIFSVLQGYLSILIPQALPQASFLLCFLLLPPILYLQFDISIFLYFPSSLFINGILWKHQSYYYSIITDILILVAGIFIVYRLNCRCNKTKL